MIKRIQNSLSSISERDSNIFKQIRWSFIFKALAFIAYFYSISIQLDILGAEMYGVWATLLSIITWVVFFDFGVGNGIKNHLTTAFARNNIQQARKIISTSYVIIFLMAVIIFVAIALAVYGFSMRAMLNTAIIPEATLKKLVIILFFFVACHFVLAFVRQFIFAVQKNALNELEQFVFYLFLIAGLLLAGVRGNRDLISVAAVYGVALALSKIILTIYFFSRYSNLIPDRRFFTRELIKPLASNSAAFFALQLVSLAVLLTDRVIIIQLLGPLHVTEYDLVYRLFSVFLVLHSIINAPMWSAYTEAYAKQDVIWIKKNIRRMNYVVLLILPALFFLVVWHEYIFSLWLGEGFAISKDVVTAMAVLIVVMTFANNYAFLLNAINKLGFQFYMLGVGAIVKLPIAMLLIKYTSMEGEAVIWATVISLLIFSMSAPLYVRTGLFK
ncbi:oligosaccharide flippase family protein [Pseudomonas stutzeri]|nr:oligosaccharide flippase family protein [Stutzerimonas stutzeri]